MGDETIQKSESIKEDVRNRYTSVAKNAQTAARNCGCGQSSCCGPVNKESYLNSIGYVVDEFETLPSSTTAAAAGCGNPTGIASLKPGEIVLDLGSGGGIDVFLAAKKVGLKGRAIGVDMTDEMLKVAEKGAKELGLQNVEFRKGDIEELPVENESVDVIISNCVINLAPSKDKVFMEAYRVLKPGGRLIVSDIVTDGPLPKEIKENPDAWASCVSGALQLDDYLGKLRSAGFSDVKVLSKRGFGGLYSAEIFARRL